MFYFFKNKSDSSFCFFSQFVIFSLFSWFTLNKPWSGSRLATKTSVRFSGRFSPSWLALHLPWRQSPMVQKSDLFDATSPEFRSPKGTIWRNWRKSSLNQAGRSPFSHQIKSLCIFSVLTSFLVNCLFSVFWRVFSLISIFPLKPKVCWFFFLPLPLCYHDFFRW